MGKSEGLTVSKRTKYPQRKNTLLAEIFIKKNLFIHLRSLSYILSKEGNKTKGFECSCSN